MGAGESTEHSSNNEKDAGDFICMNPKFGVTSGLNKIEADDPAISYFGRISTTVPTLKKLKSRKTPKAAESKKIRSFDSSEKQISRTNEVNFSWPGVVFRFRVKWPEQNGETQPRQVWLRMRGGYNFFTVQIDDHPARVLACRSKLNDYLLYKSKSGPSHPPTTTFELRKRTEAKSVFSYVTNKTTGLVSVNSIFLSPGAVLEQIVPIARDLPGFCNDRKEDAAVPQLIKHRTIEFVGDSDFAGFGNLGGKTGMGFHNAFAVSAALQNVDQSIPGHVSRAFNADYSVVAWSGVGVRWNHPMTKTDAANSTLPEMYHRLIAEDPSSEQTAFKARLPPADIVIVYVGGNDYETLRKHAETGALEGEQLHPAFSEAANVFVRTYSVFLEFIRNYRPAVPILVLTSKANGVACSRTKSEQSVFAALMTKLTKLAVEAVGGPAKHFHFAQVQPSPNLDFDCREDWGTFLHWSAAGSLKWARGVVPEVAKLTGWSSTANWGDGAATVTVTTANSEPDAPQGAQKKENLDFDLEGAARL
mmetsp:Transcript_16894/g.32994  ORF Transcript_16894/g.32994 Transcript_16894/m.32994 type:complete len:532 (-) Transcript_16894:126-1721(-)